MQGLAGCVCSQVQAAVSEQAEYHSLAATVVLVDANQAFFYCANPDNNKKARCALSSMYHPGLRVTCSEQAG